MDLGQRADEPDETRFNMAVMGLRLAGRANGVAQLHGAVSREMFNGLWPDVPVDEVPIGAITNGVHAHTWVSDEIDALLRDSVGGVWDGADEATWEGVRRLAPAQVWAARRVGRAALVEFVRSRLGDALLDPDVAHDRLRPPLRDVQAGDAAAVAARSAARAAARSATGRCSSCSPARPTRPTSRART